MGTISERVDRGVNPRLPSRRSYRGGARLQVFRERINQPSDSAAAHIYGEPAFPEIAHRRDKTGDDRAKNGLNN